MHDRRSKLIRWQNMLLPALVILTGCKQPAESTQPNPGDDTLGIACENQSGVSGPSYLTLYCVTEFDEVAVNFARNATEFVAQKFNWIFSDDPETLYSSFSFRAVRAEFAHSINLSGKGETIAIVDDGFYVNHPELTGKQITFYGPVQPEDDHGTSVAAIAAGIKDNSGMMGLAYDADLHLTSFANGLSTIADATDDARLNGAIVQNNSWAYEGTDINTILKRPNIMTAEEAFSSAVGVTLSAGTGYLDALESFSQSGVVVFARGNDEETTILGIMDALPLAFPQLEAGWITALNGVPTFNGAGEIISARRLSAECFEMARSCLMAEGVVYATSGSNSYVLPQVGTSFAAPIISGGIAILAEAFPSLGGPELRDRLFVTADNSFFTPEGTLVFTPDISHGYSSEYGHGFMDLEAALLPIGNIGVPAGLSVFNGTTSIQQNSIATGFAQGDAIISALRDVDVMLIDSLGGDFITPAETFVISSNSHNVLDSFSLFADNYQTHSGISGALKSLAFALNTNSNTHFIGGNSFDVLSGFGLLPESSGLLNAPITMSETFTKANSLGVQIPISPDSNIAAYGFASSVNPISNSKGVGVAFQFGPKTNQFSLGASVMQENGAALGMLSIADQNLTSFSRAIDVGYSAILDENISIDVNAQFGTLSSSGLGIWGKQENTTFSAYGIALNLTNVLSGNDQLVASVRHPIAIDSGTMTIALPQSRDIYGNISTSFLDIELAPTKRQLDLGLGYEVSLDQHESVIFGAAYNLNNANVPDANSVGFAISYSLGF